MDNKQMEITKQYVKRYRQREFWRKIVSVLGCFVVFCTTYALILPAITMDQGTICGMIEHQHTSDCYLMPESGHVHTDACYTEITNYVCGMEEAEDDGGFFEMLFGDESSTSSAVEYEPAEPAHTHSDACMEISSELTCGLEEAVPHSHEDTCFDENGELICELPTELEEPLLICDITPHIHSDGCFPSDEDNAVEEENTEPTEPELVCGIEAHQHEENCYDADGKLVCTIEEHTHIDDCYTEAVTEETDEPETTEPACGKEEHRHMETCYDADGSLICELEEHQHDASCYPEELVYQNITALVYTDETCTELFDNSELDTAVKIEIKGQLPVAVFAKAYPVLVEQPDKEVLCAYDITLYREDNTVYEPAGDKNITVSIQTAELEDSLQDTEQPVEVYYVPEEGEPEPVESTITEKGIRFDTTHFSVYMVTRAATDGVPKNTVKDAFLKDPAFADYYNSNSPIGTAGSFHIVAFGDARLNVHTNGNILAKNLYAGSNFGTNNYDNELSYIQNYMQVNGGSASKEKHILVLGKNNTVTKNGDYFYVTVGGSETKIDRPKNVIQDENTSVAPFIDLIRVENEIRQLSSKFSKMNEVNIEEIKRPTESDQYSILKLTKPSGVGVISLTAEELDALGGMGNSIQMKGFKTGKNGAIVVNVDCSNRSSIDMPQAYIYVDDVPQSTNEVTEFSAGKVIWNFVNAEGVVIKTNLMTGIIIAPGATINIPVNLNGTVVAENVTVLSGETHRTDFTGTVVEPDSEKKPHQITIQKHETGYIANTLPGAEFKLYKYDSNATAEDKWVVQIDDDCNPPAEILRTDSNGVIQLGGLEASVAYKLEEIKAPSGYIKSDTPFYFWIKAASTDTKPSEPADFSGSMISPGNTLFVPNDKNNSTTTSLQLEKIWKRSDGTVITGNDIPVNSITVNIYQLVNGIKPNNAYQTVTLSTENNWTVTLDNLPLKGKDANGNEVVYTYEVEENLTLNGYTVTYTETGTTITITNTAAGYELPETGGIGTHMYILAGMMLILASTVLLYNQNRHRRGKV